MRERTSTILIERFVELMERFAVQMRSRMPVAWSELELTMPQARALVLLGRGHTRMSDISAHLGCGMPSATSMIDRLVKKGLVERVEDATDRRVVACGLTSSGREVVERFWRMGRMRFEALAEVLSIDELEQVLPAMVILSEATSRLGGAETQEQGKAAGSARETSRSPMVSSPWHASNDEEP